MKAWEKLYKSEDLDEAINLAEKVSIKSNDGVLIIAQVDNHKVETFIEYASPSYSSCDCPSRYPCIHEAALTYYLKSHPEIYLESPDFDDILSMASPDDLRDFLLNEFETNPDFKDKPVDKDFYNAKLNSIFKKAEGRDFRYHGFHDLDLMENELYDFISDDIGIVLGTHDHDFACDLLIRIAKLLNDEVISGCDSWYDLAEIFMERAGLLDFSIYLEADNLDKLHANMDHIMSIL